ncbi:G-protein coupled receptor Mth2-like [Exaiptasia diaphana]|uniref:G-protein coupled receptors family 2 profile 2 domain-containing protein n=1 Tax=Exaiptasia diaphana TaxID=2652724 RepID=A0A913YLI3_EXADI|nr:G-protein coupled receptor Mth2-like [Exaiptasia diaphana]
MFFAFFLWIFLQTTLWTCTIQRDFNISFHDQTNSSQYNYTEEEEGGFGGVENLNHIFAKTEPPQPPGLQCPDNYVVDKRNNICREKLPSPTVANETTNITNGTYVFWRMNCSNQSLLMVDEGDFLVLENKSVFVNASKMTYDKSEYIWMNRSVLVCVNHAVAYQINCSGNWGLMNESEYSILSNKSIYVNASLMLYDPPKFIWNKQNLYVCDNLFVDSDNRNIMSNEDDDIISDLTIVCMSISIFALVFVLITYSLFTELRTPPGINLMNLSVAILLSQLLWLVGSKQLTDKPMVCTAIAVLLHYFFLVSFVWTSIIAFDTWRAFTAKRRRSMVDSKRKRLLHSLRYMAVGWLSVMVYVSICVALDQSQTVAIGYGSRVACWITNFDAKWIFFATPLGLVTVFNIVFFSMTVKAIRSTRSQARMFCDIQINGNLEGYGNSISC